MGYQLGIDLGTTYTAAAVCRSSDRGWAEPEIVTLGTRSATVASVLFLGRGRLGAGRRGRRAARADRPGPGGARVQAPDRRPHPDRGRRPDLGAGGAVGPAGALGRRPGGRARGRAGGPDRDHPPRVLGAAQEGPARPRAGRRRASRSRSWPSRRPPRCTTPRPSGSRPAPPSPSTTSAAARSTPPSSARPTPRRRPGRASGCSAAPRAWSGSAASTSTRSCSTTSATGLPDAFAELDDTDPAVLAAVARIRRECTEAKEALSSDTEVSIPVLLPAARGSVRLHRSEFEAADPPAGRGDGRRPCAAAVDSAGLAPEQLTAVLLVGGSSRIPLVASSSPSSSAARSPSTPTRRTRSPRAPRWPSRRSRRRPGRVWWSRRCPAVRPFGAGNRPPADGHHRRLAGAGAGGGRGAQLRRHGRPARVRRRGRGRPRGVLHGRRPAPATRPAGSCWPGRPAGHAQTVDSRPGATPGSVPAGPGSVPGRPASPPGRRSPAGHAAAHLPAAAESARTL